MGISVRSNYAANDFQPGHEIKDEFKIKQKNSDLGSL
jgi:hypothetical protein